MTTETKASGTSWQHWSTSTRIFVGAGAIAAAVIVAWLYIA